MLLDGAPDHLALNGKGVHIAPSFAWLQKLLAARHPQFHILATLGDTNFADAAIGIDGALRGLFEIVAVTHDDFARLHTGGGRNIQLHLGADVASLVGDRDKTDEWLVVGAVERGRGYLDLLHELALVGVHRIEPEHHVMLVDMGSGIAQRAKRVHRI